MYHMDTKHVNSSFRYFITEKPLNQNLSFVIIYEQGTDHFCSSNKPQNDRITPNKTTTAPSFQNAKRHLKVFWDIDHHNPIIV